MRTLPEPRKLSVNFSRPLKVEPEATPTSLWAFGPLLLWGEGIAFSI